MSRRELLVIASYNVHRCVGWDGRCDPARVAKVLAELDAQMIGVQEVSSRGGGVDQLVRLGRLAGFAFLRGPTLLRDDGSYGNGLLTRLPVRNARLIDLSLPGREPRGAIDVETELHGARIRVVVTHFGLRSSERAAQCDRLLDHLEPAEDFDLSILLGDFNEWWAPRRLLRRLHHYFGRTRSVRSFPAAAPVFNLDRIWVKPATALREIRAHRSRLARRASDHLPVRAVIELPEVVQKEGDVDVERCISQ